MLREMSNQVEGDSKRKPGKRLQLTVRCCYFYHEALRDDAEQLVLEADRRGHEV